MHDMRQRLTTQERAVVDWIVGHPNDVADATARHVADCACVSPSTVTRLCQKLGFDGWPDFKLKFAVNRRAEEMGLFADFSKSLVANGAPIGFTEKMLMRFYNGVTHATAAKIDEQTLLHFKNALRCASHIDFYATGLNHAIAQRAAFLFQTIGLSCNVYDEANVHMIERLDVDSGHLACLLSHTGENVKIMEIAEILARRRVPSIAILGSADSALGTLVDVCIELFAAPMSSMLTQLSYSLSLGYIIDLLYVSLLGDELGSFFVQSPEDYYSQLLSGAKADKAGTR